MSLDLLVSLVVIVGAALIIWVVLERFSPDPVITRIGQIVIFVVVMVVLLRRLVPLLGIEER